MSDRQDAILEVVQSPKIVYMLPATFILMLCAAATTEKFVLGCPADSLGRVDEVKGAGNRCNCSDLWSVSSSQCLLESTLASAWRSRVGIALVKGSRRDRRNHSRRRLLEVWEESSGVHRHGCTYEYNARLFAGESRRPTGLGHFSSNCYPLLLRMACGSVTLLTM
jgi:hypothetical protein